MNDLEALLENLRVGYLKELPDKISALRTGLQKRDTDGLKRLFHQLRGSGKSYGLGEISQLAQAVEEIGLSEETTQFLSACDVGVSLLELIAQARAQGQTFPLDSDPLFLDLTKGRNSRAA